MPSERQERSLERVQILDLMGQLKLAGMRAAYDEILKEGIRQQQPMPHIIGALLRAQTSAAHARSIAYQLGMAKFPRWPRRWRSSILRRCLSTRIWSVSVTAAINACVDLDQQRNLVIVGGTGTGKTHLAVAIGSNCVR